MTPAVSARIGAVIVDCRDPDRLAAFWSALLGCRIEERHGPYAWLRIADDITFGLQQVADGKRGKNRVHIDVVVNDIDAAQRTIVELGGSRVAGYESGGFLVMADPEGNEFCVIPDEPWEMDEHGRAHYLDR